MRYTRLLSEELRDLPDLWRARDNIPERIKTLRLKRDQLRAVDLTEVAGRSRSAHGVEDRLISVLSELSVLERNFEITDRRCAELEAALEGLDEEERDIIETTDVWRITDSVERLCKEKCFSKSYFYQKRREALRKMAIQYYGIDGLDKCPDGQDFGEE